MDFKGISLAINYDFPQTTASYIHQIGSAGKAVTFFAEAGVEQLRSIAHVMEASGCPVADWMLKLKPMAMDERQRRAVAPIARKPIAKRPREAAAADEASGSGAAPDDAEAADEGEAARPRKRKPGPVWAPRKLANRKAAAEGGGVTVFNLYQKLLAL